MSLKFKLWIVSQGLLLITACIIQFTFHREIQVGPILGTERRDYFDIISNVEPEIPKKFPQKAISPKTFSFGFVF